MLRRRSRARSALLLAYVLLFTSIMVQACVGLKLGSITITASPTTITIGETTTISGSITPESLGESITIWHRLTGKPWAVLKTVTTDGTGKYSYDWNVDIHTTLGTYELKATWIGDEYAAESLPPHPEVDVVAVHDIAIIGVFASPASASVGDTIDLDVTVKNKGHFSETFEVYAYADLDTSGFPKRYCFGCDPIGKVLAPSATTIVSFAWVTSGVDEGTYTITAEIPAVPGETNKADNTGTDKVTLSEVHDIAITDVVASPSEVAPGDSVSIEVSLENQGTEEETFDVTAKYNATVIDTHSVTLAAGATTTESFAWVTSGVDEGTYTISAHAYPVPGEADTTDNTHTDSTVKIVLPKETPVVSFTYSPLSPVVNGTVTFNASASYDPDGTIVSYEWDFGDGTTKTYVEGVNLTDTTTHAYANNGTYTVTLKVTDNDGLSNATSKNITVLNTSLNTPPNATFTESAETVYTGEVITFNASDSYDPDGNITIYFWNFGDETTKIYVKGVNLTDTTTHAYADNGTYTVTLIVTDDDGATHNATATKTVLNRSPVALFTESAETVYLNVTIYFNASGSYDPDGNITSYFWTFGDGNNATGVTAEHSYPLEGNYTVTLTVTDDDGATNSTSASKVILNRSPVALFTESAETVYTNETIYFNASESYDSDGFIISYFWDFGDETNATGVAVEHAFIDDGNYTIILTVTNDDNATDTATAIKTVLNRPPVAIFIESTETTYIGETIAFNASDSYDPDGNITIYFWNFGDETTKIYVKGVNLTDTTTHAYADNGTYTVTLIVTDDDGATHNATATKTVLNRPPVAVFTESTETAYVGEAITFNASDSYDLDGIIASYFWNFGDGTSTTGAIVNHAYDINGTFTVTLTVTDDDDASNSSSSTKTILINEPPVALFTESAETVYTGEVITFSASDSYDPDGNITNYFWDFGDETNTTGVTVDHAYVDDGVYTVTLVVTDDDGESASKSAVKTVSNRPPTASFTENPTIVLTGEIIHFDASSSNDPDGSVISYLWDFGDGTDATGVTVNHAYEDDGNYTVTLVVTDDDGGTASKSAVKVVSNRPPAALFTANATIADADELIRFDASGSYDPDGSILSYFWDFGDGTNVTMCVILGHIYAENGDYTVTLTVTDDDGASSSVSSTISVKTSSRWPLALIAGIAFGITALTGTAIYAIYGRRKKSVNDAPALADKPIVTLYVSRGLFAGYEESH